MIGLPGWAWRMIGVAVVLAVVALSAGRAGYRLADNRWQALEAKRLAAEAQALAEDRARAQAVAAAYEGVRAELARLAGCSSTPLKIEREPPPALVAPCEAPPKRPVTDMGALLTLATEALDAFSACSARQRALAEWATR